MKETATFNAETAEVAETNQGILCVLGELRV